jgi:hypothetical protein
VQDLPNRFKSHSFSLSRSSSQLLSKSDCYSYHPSAALVFLLIHEDTLFCAADSSTG